MRVSFLLRRSASFSPFLPDCGIAAVSPRFLTHPCQAARAWAETTRCSVRVAGNGVAEPGANGSDLATVATLTFPLADRAGDGPEPGVAAELGEPVEHCSVLGDRGVVGQGPPAALRRGVWLAFSTTPLRFPRRRG